MVKDHTAANQELTTLAHNKNIALPAALRNDQQQKYDELNTQGGSDFDKKYMSLMVKDHKKDTESFQEQARDGKDADIKNWAASKIATLKLHLSEAQSIDSLLDAKH